MPADTAKQSGTHRGLCHEKPRDFVRTGERDGQYGWTAGLRPADSDPTFVLPAGRPPPAELSARHFECLAAAVAQHVYFARLRAGLQVVLVTSVGNLL